MGIGLYTDILATFYGLGSILPCRGFGISEVRAGSVDFKFACGSRWYSVSLGRPTTGWALTNHLNRPEIERTKLANGDWTVYGHSSYFLWFRKHFALTGFWYFWTGLSQNRQWRDKRMTIPSKPKMWIFLKIIERILIAFCLTNKPINKLSCENLGQKLQFSS